MLRNCTKDKVILWIGLCTYMARPWVFRIAHRFFYKHGHRIFSEHSWVTLYRTMISDPAADHLYEDPVLAAVHVEIKDNTEQIEYWAELVNSLQQYYEGTGVIC